MHLCGIVVVTVKGRGMRKKFTILYPSDHPEVEKRGTPFKTKGKDMLVMNNGGIFFIFNGETYYPSIRKLTHDLPKYEVKWGD